MRKFGLGFRKALGAVAVALAVSSVSAPAITLDFASIVGARVQFDGNADTFSFIPTDPALNQFQITSSDGAGDSLGLAGRMNGSFNIGAISTIGGLQTASVSGSGQVVIHDGLGNDLTGSLTWDSISTFGTGGAINVNGSLNLASLSYSGSRADLIALAASGVGSEVISFQFVPGKTLTELTTDGMVYKTSFSGSVSGTETATLVPDGGSTLMLLGMALGGFGLFWRRQTA